MKSLEFCYFLGEMCDFIHFISMAIGHKRQKTQGPSLGVGGHLTCPGQLTQRSGQYNKWKILF